MRARVVSLFAAALIITVALAGQPASAAPLPGASQAPDITPSLVLAQPGNAFVHVGTVGNTETNNTYVDDPSLNGNQSARLLVTLQLDAEGTSTLRDDHPANLLFASSPGAWAISNGDGAAMPDNTNWNVFVPPQDDTLITHSAFSSNTSGDHTTIDNPLINGDPNAILFVTPVENPGIFGGAAGAAGPAVPAGDGPFTHTLAVAYDGVHARWTIRTADGQNLPTPMAFYVLKASADETAFTTISAAPHLRSDAATIDNPLTNNNPDAMILVTANYGAGVTNKLNNHFLGVFYEAGSGHWLIFNQDAAPMTDGVMFNVLVIPPKSGAMLVKAGSNNAIHVRLDNPDLDGNPYARVYVMHNWNPPKSPGGKFNDHPIGVSYDGTGDHHWYVYNRNSAPMTTTAAFNVYYTWPRANSFTISADKFNTDTVTGMTLNSPLLNDQSSARAILSYSKSPNGSPGGDYTHQVGLLFGVDLFWHISGESGPNFPPDLSYNVVVPPTSQSFVVVANTGSGGNAADNDLVLNNPLTNGDPRALVFATPRGLTALDTHNLGVYYTGSGWGIFNEDGAAIVNGQAFDVFVVKRHFVDLPVTLR